MLGTIKRRRSLYKRQTISYRYIAMYLTQESSIRALFQSFVSSFYAAHVGVVCTM